MNLDNDDKVRECLERKGKADKLKRVMKEVDAFRNELGRKTGVTESSAEMIREDRDHGH